MKKPYYLKTLTNIIIIIKFIGDLKNDFRCKSN